MICPLKMVGKSAVEILKEREYGDESTMQCEKEQCAWWDDRVQNCCVYNLRGDYDASRREKVIRLD